MVMLQVHIVLVTMLLLAVNIYGVVLLEQDFDEDWFIPSGTYAYDYLQARSKYYPEDGIPAVMYTGNTHSSKMSSLIFYM